MRFSLIIHLSELYSEIIMKEMFYKRSHKKLVYITILFYMVIYTANNDLSVVKL